MNKDKQFYLLVILATTFYSCSSTKVVSGKIHGQNLGACEIAEGRNTEDISCDIKKSDDGNYLVELNFKKVSQKQIPTCVFDGAGATNKMKNAGKKIETINTLISTSQIWIEVPTIKASPLKMYGDLIMQFICIL